jgi:hypothetical protein
MEKRGLVQPVYRIILYPGVNMARKKWGEIWGREKGFFKGKSQESAFKIHPGGLGGDF